MRTCLHPAHLLSTKKGMFPGEHRTSHPPPLLQRPCTHLLSTKNGMFWSFHRMWRASASGPAVPMGSGSCSPSGGGVVEEGWRGSELDVMRQGSGQPPRLRRRSSSRRSCTRCRCYRGRHCCCPPPPPPPPPTPTHPHPTHPTHPPTCEHVILMPSFSSHSFRKSIITCCDDGNRGGVEGYVDSEGTE